MSSIQIKLKSFLHGRHPVGKQYAWVDQNCHCYISSHVRVHTPALKMVILHIELKSEFSIVEYKHQATIWLSGVKDMI